MRKKIFIILSLLLLHHFLNAKKMDYSLYKILNYLEKKKLSQINLTSTHTNFITSIPYITNKKLSLIVKGKNLEDFLNSAGCKINSQINNNIYTISISPDNLIKLYNFPLVKYISAPQKLHPRLDRAVPIIKAEYAYNIGYTGKNVLIGIIDSGIYYQHPMFKDSNGNSRIIYIWDQTDPANTGTGSINYKYTYGREWTKWEIEAGVCTEDDNESGHGTHVCGIAAGNSILKGVAKNGNIIFVKAILDTVHIIDAVNYLIDLANKYNMPIVINLSLGNSYGPHDGSDIFSQALSKLTGAGKIIVKAAGNNGKTSRFIHYRVNTLNPFSATNIVIDKNNSINSTGNNYIRLDIWYDGNDKITSSLLTNNNLFLKCNYHSAVNSVSPYGTVTIENAPYGADINNNDNEILISIDDSKNQSDLTRLFQCTFTIKFSNTVGNTTQPIDIWVYESSVDAGFDNSDSSYSLDSDSCNSNLIIVGATVSRNIYTNQDYDTYFSTAGALYDIANFSSQGPTRTGGLKPDISAPGALILSALVPDLKYTYYTYTDYKYDGYVYMQGTSMSTPLVTGAVALLLERNKNLTPKDIINYLKNNSQNSGIYKLNAGVWDKKFGYGVLSLENLSSINKEESINNIIFSNSSDIITIYRNVISINKNNPAIIMINKKGEYNIGIYNMIGNLIYSFEPNEYYNGDILVWDGKDKYNKEVLPGLYYMVEKNHKIVKKIMVIK